MGEKTLQMYQWTKMGTQRGKKVDKINRLADMRTERDLMDKSYYQKWTKKTDRLDNCPLI